VPFESSSRLERIEQVDAVRCALREQSMETSTLFWVRTDRVPQGHDSDSETTFYKTHEDTPSDRAIATTITSLSNWFLFIHAQTQVPLPVRMIFNSKVRELR
jgi:hypothetical protein